MAVAVQQSVSISLLHLGEERSEEVRKGQERSSGEKEWHDGANEAYKGDEYNGSNRPFIFLKMIGPGLILTATFPLVVHGVL
jgi:hypothetical protein